MVTRERIAERLKRFEILAGIEYSSKAAGIWYERFKGYDDKKFISICEKIENDIKWHILPTLADFYAISPLQTGGAWL